MSDYGANWIKVDPVRILKILRHHKREEEKVGRLSFYPSLYDIPTALQVIVPSESEKVEILFQYMDDEESNKSTVEGSGISLLAGKNSGRIYRILLDINLLKCDIEGLSSRLREMIEDAGFSVDSQSRSYEAVSDLITNDSPIQLKELAHCQN